MKIATFCLLSLLKAYEVDHEQIPKYGYGSENGPSKWHELDPSYYLCKDGKMQSPIEINMNTLGTIVDFSYQELYFKWDKLKNAHLIKDGGTLHLEIPVSTTDGLTYNGTDFFMRNIHAHINSEHVIFGHQYPIELHFLHKSNQGNLLVVSIVGQIQEKTHQFLHQFIETDLENKDGASVIIPEVSFEELLETLDGLKDFWKYQGSLTIPPCTEQVHWFVSSIDKFIGISHIHWDKLKEFLPKPFNNRPIQRR